MTEVKALRLAIDARGMRTGAQEATTATDRVIQGSRGADRAVHGLNDRMVATSKSGAMLKRALAGIFVGMSTTLAVRQLIAVNAQFDQITATLQAVTRIADRSDAGFQKLVKQARELGALTKFSATEAAEGQLFLGRAGLSTQAILDATPGTLNLAAAAALNLGEASEIASNIMSQFQKKAGEMNKIGDILVNTANAANTDVRQLSEGLKFAGPIAGALGIHLEDTAAALGILANNGIQASLAGTNLRGIMTTLIKPSKEGTATLKSMGIALKDMDPASNSLIDILQRLADANMTVAQATSIFQIRNAGAAVALANNIDKVRELAQANRDATGEAERNARIMNDTLPGAWAELGSAVEEAALAIGDLGVTGGLKKFLLFSGDVIRVLAGMEESVNKNNVAARQIAEAIKFVAMWLSLLIGMKLLLFFGSLSTSLFGVVTAVKAITAAMAANPIGALLVALTTGIALLIKYRDHLVTIGGVTLTLGDVMSAVWEHFLDTFKFVGEVTMKSWDFVWEAVQGTFQRVWGNMTAIFGVTTAFFGNDWRRVLDFMMMLVKKFANFTTAIFVALGKTVALLADRLVGAFKDFDITNPASLLKVGKNLQQAFNPSTLALDIAGEWHKAFAKDWVKDAFDLGKRIGVGVRMGISLIMGRDVTEDFNKFFTPEGISEDIAKRIQQKGMQRNFDMTMGAVPTGAVPTGAVPTGVVPTGASLESLLAEEMEELADATEVLSNSQEEARKQFEELMPQIMAERNLIMLNTEARERAIFALEAETLAREGGIANATAQIEKLKEEFALNQKMTEVKQLADEAAGHFTDTFEAILTGSLTAADAVKELAKELYKMALQQIVLAPFKNMLSTGFSAMFSPAATGGVYNYGVKQFAAGGITTGPELFPMAGGNVGLRGEAGPEAIVPLPNGRSIPVDMRGQSREATTINVHQTINVKAQNMDEFRMARRDLARASRQAISDAWGSR